MKKLFTIAFVMFFAFSLSAQTYSVTFNVNMKAAIDSGIFNPETDTLFLAGNMIGNWAEPGTDIANQMMADADSDSVYTKVLQLPGDTTLQYKYFKNSGWNNGEWSGDPNRIVSVTDADVELNDVWGVQPASISELNANVRFAPNPTEGVLRITADNNYNVTVYDITGRVIETAVMTNNTSSIDFTKAQSGVYLIKLSNGQQSATYKIIKK